MAPSSPIQALICQQKRRQIGSLVIAAVSAAGAGAAAVILLGLSGWFLTGAAIAGAAGPAVVGAFNYLLPSAGIRALAIMRTGLRYAERLAGHAAAFKALAEIRPALFAGLARAPTDKALSLSSGEATARLVQDVDAIESLFVRMSAPWAAVTSALAALALIALASPLAVFAFVAAWAAQLAAGAWIVHVRSRSSAGGVLRETGALKSRLLPYAAAAAELRCLGLTDAVVDELMAGDRRLGEARRRSWNGLAEVAALQPCMTGATAAGVLALCWHAQPAIAALAALSATVAMEGAGGLIQAFERTGAVHAASARLDDVLASPITTCSEAVGPDPAITLHLNGRRFHLTPGDRWALTGPSGAGKTQVLEGFVGLRTPAAGEIAIDGRPLERLDIQGVRSLFAYAPQNAAMISGAIRDNLLLGDPSVTDEAMYQALETAQLADKVRAMPGALDAWIGEGGAQLSGGERRRLSVARALLRRAPWLLLDEPTEGLDAETEARLIEGLDAHLSSSGRGLILISHRTAPLAICRRTIELPTWRDQQPANLLAANEAGEGQRTNAIRSTP